MRADDTVFLVYVHFTEIDGAQDLNSEARHCRALHGQTYKLLAAALRVEHYSQRTPVYHGASRQQSFAQF